MTQDEIIEMAEQAGMTQDGDMWFSFGKGDMDVEHEHLVAFAKLVAAKAIAGLESQEHNFCPRFGKRTNDIHTCTPPRDNT
jgi:hypothetical protein